MENFRDQDDYYLLYCKIPTSLHPHHAQCVGSTQGYRVSSLIVVLITCGIKTSIQQDRLAVVSVDCPKFNIGLLE